MKHARFSRRFGSLRVLSVAFPYSLLVLTLLLSVIATANAQNVQHQQATVDHGFRSDLKIDPSTLALSLQLPLRAYPGRAGLGVPVTLYYSSKVWTMEYGGYYQEGTCCAPSFTANPQGMPTDNEYSWVNVYYAMSSAGQGSNAGWTGSLDFPYVVGGMIARYNFEGDPCDACELDQSRWVKRIQIRMPDGSTHELRRSDSVYFSNNVNDIGTYYAVDGSNLRYVEENTSGAATLYLPDGSRYLMGQTPQQYIDRSGNTLTYNTNGTVTDTLGRAVGLQYVSGTADQIYSLTGLNGTPANYTFRYRHLGDSGVMTTSEGLANMGDSVPYGAVTFGAGLFTSAGGSRTTPRSLFNPMVLYQLALPNGQSYTFTYNVYGEIDKVVYPGGGYEKFRYDTLPGLDPLNEPYAQANRGVVERWVSADGTENNFAHWTYTVVSSSPYTIRTTAPDGSYSERVLQKGRGPGVLKFGFDDARAGMPLEERAYSASGQMLRRTLMSYDVSGPLSGGYDGATRNPRLTKKVDIILDTGGDALAAITTMAYDADLNVIATNQYDYFTVSASTAQTGSINSFVTAEPPARTSEATFLVNDPNVDAGVRAAYRNRNLLSLPTSSRVKDSNGNVVAQSSIGYDETSLQVIGSTNGWTDPQTPYRGNVTSTGSWMNTASTYLTTHATYDQFGNVRTTTDAKGNQSQIDYSSTYSYAYPTLSTSADPDGNGPLVPLTSATEYDLSTGLVTASVDANGQRTSFAYDDPLNRLTQTVRAVNGGVNEKSQTTITYNDTARTITSTSDQSTYDDNLLKSQVLYDGLGRAIESRQYEGGTNYVAVQTQYDSMGRAFKTSNPFRPWQSETAVWTTSAFDALGRAILVTTPDNAAVTTSFSGNIVTVTDQAGKKRRSVTDALGRLVRVDEPDANGNLDVNGAPAQSTLYAYDTLDNLTTVTQGSQTRTFVYDSLKRLTSGTNPESGTVSYQYDNNGNLTQKSDARSIVPTYVYDALNRVTSRSYSDGTPTVTYAYDSTTIANGKGRLASVTSSVSAYTYGDYDALGRATGATQTIGSQNYYVGYTYDLAGHVKTMTYPSGRSITNTFDDAGRLNSFAGTLGDGTPRTYSTGISYSSLGGMTEEQFGTQTALYHKLHYNVRGQLNDIRASTVPWQTDQWNWNRGAIVNYYATADFSCQTNDCMAHSGSDNNGNVIRQQSWVPGNDSASTYTYTQDTFSYDSLNRLSSVTELHGSQASQSGTDFVQAYAYDRFGNRTINAGATSGTGINNKQFSVDANTNRLGVPSGQSGAMIYDNVGNLTTDTYSAAAITRVYDAENRMTKETQANSYDAGIYSYDGDGHRVKRNVGGVDTWQVYGIGGELIAEYAANAAPSNPQKEYGYRNGELLITAETSISTSANNSLSLNGSSAYAEIPNSASLNITGALTLEAWVKTSSTTGYQQIVSRYGYGASNGGYELLLYNGKVRLDIFHNGTSYSWLAGNTVISANEWHHVAGVFDGTQYRVYLDGVLDGQSSSTFAPYSGTGSVVIGRAGGDAVQYFSGLIDEVRISSGAVYTNAFTPAAHLVPLGGTAGLWKFDGQSLGDASGNGNQAALAGGAAYSGTVPAQPGHSLSLNGTSQYVEIPNSDSLNITGALTLEAWVKTSSTTGYQQIVSRYGYGASNGGYELLLYNGKVRLDIFHSGTSYTWVAGNTVMSANVWHHVAAVFDGNECRVYLDGNLDGSMASTFAPYSGNGSLIIGRAGGDAVQYFNGMIDEVRVTAGAVYSGNFTPTANLVSVPGTVGLWKFDFQTANDTSGNGNNGTVQGGAGYSANIPLDTGTTTTAQIHWLVTDQLGTPRMVVDQTGSLSGVSRHDYLPFGEELFGGPPSNPGVGGRLTTQGYVGDIMRQKFTQKERDNETGLDYFRARYFASTHGRFTSPDPLLSSATIYDPQTWNRYGYVLNNPLRYIDPLGLYEWDASLGGSATDEELKKRKGGQKIIDRRNEFRNALSKAAADATNKSLTEAQRTAIQRSVNAYGTEGQANGVSVAFGKVTEGAAAETGYSKDATGRVNAFTTDEQGKVTAHITVTFGGKIEEDQVAHEGSHVADRQDLGLAFERALQTTNFTLTVDDLPENITKYETEFRAYQVTSAVNQARGTPSEVWNRGWSEADRATAINKLLRTNNLYKVTPENPGGRIYREVSH